MRLVLYHCVRCHLLWHQAVRDGVDSGYDPNTDREVTAKDIRDKREDPLQALCQQCQEVGWQYIEVVNANSTQ